MEAHEHTMEETVTAHEVNVMGLFYAADGNGTPTNADDLGIDVDDVEDSARAALDGYALSVEPRTVLRVVLGIGGPTTFMEAPISPDVVGWSRDAAVTFFDSWAVPSETVLNEESALTRLFDEHVDMYQPEG